MKFFTNQKANILQMIMQTANKPKCVHTIDKLSINIFHTVETNQVME